MRTQKNHTTIVLTAATLMVGAGACWSSALAGDPPKPPRADPAAQSSSNAASIGEFHTASALLRKSAANANGEVVGEFQDFIFDRGSGRIEYALVKSGAVIGIGGRTIAVPYARLGYDTVSDRFLLDMTKEQIDREAEFVPENWKELNHVSWEDELDAMFSSSSSDAMRATDDVPAERLASAPEKRVKGTITGVRRTQTRFGGEQAVVTVRTDNGTTHELLLGPSWYVMGLDAAPMRGDSIDAQTRVWDESGVTRLIATTAKIDGESVTLRDKNLAPQWSVPREASKKSSSDSAEARAAEGRLELMSDLIGSSALALDKNGGEVQDVIIERRSGRIAMIGFDPNENLLGLADTIRCVPWSVVSVRDDETVAIDATIDMLTSCQEMPAEVSAFNAPSRLEPVYRAFEVDVERFEPLARDSGRDVSAKDGYGWLDAARHGKDTTISGTVVSLWSGTVSPGEPQSQILAIKSGTTTTNVVLGPAWYVDRQRLELSPNVEVSVAGREVTVDGRRYVVARTVTCNGQTMLFWDGNEPAWASAN